ncbi:MAG: hypothetical protein AB7T31_10345 [Gemmatimonadales bacterium]
MTAESVIEVRVREISQLLDSLDPSPFHRRDLNPAAEEYIVASAKELPSRAADVLVVHLDRSTGLPDEGHVIGDVIRTHFSRRASFLRRDLRELVRRGLISLCIGLAFLTTMFVIARAIDPLLGEAGFGALLRESMLIVGWVAMWRPMEIFLYDWWPIAGERRLHDRLSRLDVRVTHGDSVSDR